MTLGCFVNLGNVPLPTRTETITSLLEFYARKNCHQPHRRHAGEFKSRATRWGRSCPTNKWGLKSFTASESQRDSPRQANALAEGESSLLQHKCQVQRGHYQ